MATNPKTKITRLTVGRLYNLGNYEHVRYELTVDIGEGRSAALALRNIMRVLKAANPKSPVASYDLESARKKLEDPQSWHKNVADPKERKKLIKEMVRSAKELVRSWDAWVARRKAAERLLDDIGASKVHKDAKLTWGDDDDDWDN